MQGLELVPLEMAEADEYWKTFVSGRTDQPTTNFVTHMERYLGLSYEEQQTYFAFKDGGRIVGTVRIGASSLTEAPSALTFFSLLPEARSSLRDAILLATEPLIAGGASAIQASFDEPYGEAFEKAGFRLQFSRMRMELSPLARREKPDIAMAHPEATDVEDTAVFFMDVYEGHMEQAFGMHVGTPGEWRDYVTSIWKGDGGKYLPLASWIARDESGLTGASLVSEWMGSPLLAEMGVRKDFRGRGLARALLSGTINSLCDLSYDSLSLYVTIGNDPAIRLYGSMGFRQAGSRSVTAVLEM